MSDRRAMSAPSQPELDLPLATGSSTATDEEAPCTMGRRTRQSRWRPQMGSSIFFGGSVVAAVVAGMIALFAPCCISVMLPAYFASSFQNRRVLVAMTFVFAAGIATVI